MDIYIYVLDALRPDFLGCYGGDEDVSPNIDQLANDAVIFENAYATSTWTKPSGASILTGEYPSAVNMNHTYDVLDSSVTLLPEILEKRGHTTVGVTGQGFISEKFGLGRGYNEFVNLRERPDLVNSGRTSAGLASDEELVLPDSYDINATLFEFLNKIENDVFSLIWSVDTHDPYYVPGTESHFNNTGEEYVPAGDLERYIAEEGVEKVHSLYKEMIRYNDKAIGEFVNHLRKRGCYENSLILLTSDHGEAFGEHGEVGHAGLVHEEQIRVPLIVKFPKSEQQSERIGSPTSLVDIFATVLDVGGAHCQPDDGKSLLEIIENKGGNRPIFSETFYEPGDAHSKAVRFGDYKWMSVNYPNPVQASGVKEFGRRLLDLPELLRWWRDRFYNVENDPEETRPLHRRTEPEPMANARAHLFESIRTRANERDNLTWTASDEEAEKVEERLRHLGYVE